MKKYHPAPETMGLGGHQRLPFLDVGRSLGTAHRMAAAHLMGINHYEQGHPVASPVRPCPLNLIGGSL